MGLLLLCGVLGRTGQFSSQVLVVVTYDIADHGLSSLHGQEDVALLVLDSAVFDRSSDDRKAHADALSLQYHLRQIVGSFFSFVKGELLCLEPFA